MTPKHAPATPLPWHQKVIGLGGVTNKTPISEISGVAEYIYQTDAVYATHSANAYPRLVEALRQMHRVVSHIKDAPLADPLRYVPVSAYQEAYNSTSSLLRELGEL